MNILNDWHVEKRSQRHENTMTRSFNMNNRTKTFPLHRNCAPSIHVIKADRLSGNTWTITWSTLSPSSSNCGTWFDCGVCDDGTRSKVVKQQFFMDFLLSLLFLIALRSRRSRRFRVLFTQNLPVDISTDNVYRNGERINSTSSWSTMTLLTLIQCQVWGLECNYGTESVSELVVQINYLVRAISADYHK